MLRTAALCGALLNGLLTPLTISQTDIVSAGTNVWTSNSIRCPSARTLSSGSCLSERCDRAYGGKPGFPLGSLPEANCTTAWTRDAGQRTHARWPGPCPCGQGRQVPHRPQADPRSSPRTASRHGPRPLGLPSALALHRDGPPGRRRRQAGLGRTHRRVRRSIDGRPCCGGQPGQARERTPAPDGLSQESPLQRRQGLPAVGWSSWASSRTAGRGLHSSTGCHRPTTAEAACGFCQARAVGARP
jgi:hypothetical protein